MENKFHEKRALQKAMHYSRLTFTADQTNAVFGLDKSLLLYPTH
jgi:hypothetical protein